MPELPDDMYCSQQIMVPPMFPYILRQYAKAAIRSQPTDLLRWSTAYFRCLSQNVPPPIKPRLEYPPPRYYEGITPGWLKALLYAFANNQYVDFKQLWDRWIGSCQQHQVLINILCLGDFTDAMAIPLLRFLGLCVALLCENLTQTMIIFCEVVTEEPEGGSAMVPIDTFIDVYTFLAKIQASKKAVLLNRFFTEAALNLVEKATERKLEEEAKKEESLPLERKKSEEKVARQTKATKGLEEERKQTISCPDLTEEVEPGSYSVLDQSNESGSEQGQPDSTSDDKSQQAGLEDYSQVNEEVGEGKRMHGETTEETTDDLLYGQSVSDLEAAGEYDQEELKGEGEQTEEDGTDEYPQEMSSMDDSSKLPKICADYLADVEVEGEKKSEETSVKSSQDMNLPFEIEEVVVERVPGIGRLVPDEVVNAVVAFMQKCAAEQQGMVMPRNIRHYSCPPLEE